MKKLEDLISTYKDFPKKGIHFKDVLEIVQEPETFRELIIKMSSNHIIKNSQAIISIDARGFIFGSAIALQSSKPMIFARKPGKLPGEVIKQTYELEYGENTISIQKKALSKYKSFSIVDDLIATGGTAKSVANILRNEGKIITGLLTVVELEEFALSRNLDFPMDSIIKL
jgi:adenine phosphoribosyltransferase